MYFFSTDDSYIVNTTTTTKGLRPLGTIIPVGGLLRSPTQDEALFTSHLHSFQSLQCLVTLLLLYPSH
jgi:hypothetical protein